MTMLENLYTKTKVNLSLCGSQSRMVEWRQIHLFFTLILDEYIHNVNLLYILWKQSDV